MERKDIYKLNPKIQDYKDVRRGDLVERRKSKRKECLDQRRNCIEECNKNQDVQSTISKGKENRRDLLKKWKEEQKRENQKNMKKPFVVGIVRHNPGSPMFKPVAPLREVRKLAKVQVTRPQATTSTATATATSTTTGVYCFGRQNPAQHKFKVANSVKKLTVPITPSFMDPSKRGKLALKSKAETSAALASKQKANTTYKKTVKANPAPAEKRVTRAMTAAKGAVRKSPIKKVVAKNVNESSKANPSRKVAFEGNHQTDDVRTPEVETTFKNVVPTPAVTRKSDKDASSSKLRRSRRHRVAFEVDHSDENITPEANRIVQHFVPTPAPRIKQQVDSDEDENEAEDEAHIVMETDTNASAENTSNTAREAQEFYDRLQRETDALLQCCDSWSRPAFTQSVPQEVSDEIDSTVGQARLLVSDKFQQFKRLIHRFEEGSQPPVTSEDLNGFWDMIYIQVDKMNERFDHLADLKGRNWTKKTVEIAAKKKVAAKPKATKPVVKSRFQEFMAKKKLETSKKSCDSQNETPGKGTQSKTDTPVGTPLQDKMMQLALDTSRSERRRSSLASASRVLRTSLIAKTLASPLTSKTAKVDHKQL